MFFWRLLSNFVLKASLAVVELRCQMLTIESFSWQRVFSLHLSLKRIVWLKL